MLRTIARAATITLAASHASAESYPGIQNHDVQLWFIEEPCTKVIETIDAFDDAAGEQLGAAILAISISAISGKSDAEIDLAAAPLVDVLAIAGFSTMAFGFIMGFEVENPGIRGDHETVLMRLRDDCAADPTKTAMTYLRGYAE